jgi:uncharacterized PurR-regulated membrane protein YhhQ (DUF165 family)
MATGADDVGLYRLRSASDAALHGQYAYGRRETLWQRLVGAMLVVGRLVLPVLLLLSALAAMYLYKDTKAPPVPGLDALNGGWLTVSHLILPTSFFAVALTNRRYGPAYAFAQVAIACAITTAVTLFAGDSITSIVQAPTAPLSRIVAAFGIAFLSANFVAILVFDGARGPRWWAAPLLSSLAAAVTYSVVFTPVAYAGTADFSLVQAGAYCGVLVAAGVVLLIPYWLLRGLVPPLSGFGGY